MRRHDLRERGYTKFKTLKNDATGRTAEIKVDKSSGQFACQIDDATKESKDLREVEQWANKIISKTEKRVLDFVPVIRAQIEEGYGFSRRRDSDNDHRSEEIKVSASRFWIALADKDPDDREVWRALKWSEGDPDSPGYVQPTDQLAKSTIFRQPQERGIYGGNDMSKAQEKGWVRLPEVTHKQYLIEFTPEVWAGIQHCLDVIEHEADVLSDLFKTKAGHAKLAAIGLKKEPLLLHAGSAK